jgi:hypothetical protein
MIAVTYSPQISMASPLPPQSLENLLNYLSLASVACGAIGSISALGVDFLRRRVSAKAAEYAASNDFKMLRADLIETHGDLQNFVQEYRQDRTIQQRNYVDMCERVARLEAKIGD